MTSTMQQPKSDVLADRETAIFLFPGIALVVLGLSSIAFSMFFTIGTVLLIGCLLMAAGIAECIHAIRARHNNTIFNILSGLLYLSIGALLLSNPIAGAVSLTLVLSTFFVIAGILRCAHAVRQRNHRSWALFLSSGIMDIILGSLVAIGWPLASLWVIGLFVGVEMLMYGFAYLALSANMRKRRQATS